MSFSFPDFLTTFVSIVVEALPFIVVGALVSGILEEMLPQEFFSRWLPKNRTLAIVGSSLAGLVLPMCECGIVPVMRRLLRKGVPASCAVTYMLSAPGMNFIVLSSTALAFWTEQYTILGVPGLAMVLLRFSGAFVTAVLVGHVIATIESRGESVVKDSIPRARLVRSAEAERLEHEASHAEPPSDAQETATGTFETVVLDTQAEGPPAPPRRSLLDRLTAIADIALHDFIDIAAFLVIGAALAAVVNTSFERSQLDALAQNSSLSIAALMILAMLLSLCSEADAFVAANFTSLGTGAKLGFLVVGPMLDVKLFIMYRWVFPAKIVAAMVVTLLGVIFAYASIVDWFWPLEEMTTG